MSTATAAKPTDWAAEDARELAQLAGKVAAEELARVADFLPWMGANCADTPADLPVAGEDQLCHVLFSVDAHQRAADHFDGLLMYARGKIHREIAQKLLLRAEAAVVLHAETSR